jgi:myo-inositol-1-phosphate synthase
MNIQVNSNYHQEGRIPATLQAVFLASNRGREVNKPPPGKAGSKVFFHNWLFQREAESKERDTHLLRKRKVKDVKKKTKQESPRGVALNAPKTNVSADFSTQSKRTSDTIDRHSYSRQHFFYAAQYADLVS